MQSREIGNQRKQYKSKNGISYSKNSLFADAVSTTALHRAEKRGRSEGKRAKWGTRRAPKGESARTPLSIGRFFLTLRQFRNLYTHAYDQIYSAFGTRRFPHLQPPRFFGCP
jgi:hypothetical protein